MEGRTHGRTYIWKDVHREGRITGMNVHREGHTHGGIYLYIEEDICMKGHSMEGTNIRRGHTYSRYRRDIYMERI